MISRRRFTAMAAGAAAYSVITSRKGYGFQTQTHDVEVHAGVQIGVIKPELHGHFVEHLGSCTYGGLWVGKNSTVPHINGHRKAAVEYLKHVGIPVLRWPGGCFADDYHWRDGIGPAEKRPKTVNIHWGNYTEDNSFGTHEFIELCRLIGAEPYLAGNVGSGTPQEFRDWVEYCNYPAGSTLSDERARNGSPAPFKVKYWGVGNENWACGGNMTPDDYAIHYRRFRTYIRNFGDTPPFLIACGPNRNDVDWTRRFMLQVGRERLYPHGYAMHFYSNSRLFATKFTPEAMQEQFASFGGLEKGIHQQRALLDSFDPDRKVGLLIDEWGVWDRMDPDDEKRYGRLWQQITMRCAVAAALGLNVFHRHAEKLVMCNIAQTVNVLHSLLLTEGDKCIRTPTYWAFDLMKDHRGKTSVRTAAEETGLSVSASRSERELIVTLVNTRHEAAMKIRCSVAGAAAGSASGQILTHTDLNAHNTFDRPDAVISRDHPVAVTAGRIEVDLPPLSVMTAKVRLG